MRMLSVVDTKNNGICKQPLSFLYMVKTLNFGSHLPSFVHFKLKREVQIILRGIVHLGPARDLLCHGLYITKRNIISRPAEPLKLEVMFHNKEDCILLKKLVYFVGVNTAQYYGPPSDAGTGNR